MSQEAKTRLRALQITGTIEKKDKGMNKQVLDKLKVERERGITGPYVMPLAKCWC